METDRRTRKRKIGDAGEDAACKLLDREGYSVLLRNFSCKIGEIDIIAIDGRRNILAFIEVKTRRNTDFGLPCQAVDREKQHKMRRCAEVFLLRNRRFTMLQPSLDIIEVLHTDKGIFARHIKNAFGEV